MSKNLVTLEDLHTHTHTHTDIRLINRFENNSCKFWGARIICIAQSLIRDG